MTLLLRWDSFHSMRSVSPTRSSLRSMEGMRPRPSPKGRPALTKSPTRARWPVVAGLVVGYRWPSSPTPPTYAPRDGAASLPEQRRPSRHPHAVLLGKRLRLLVARVHVPHHAHARIGGQHPLEPPRCAVGAVGHHHHSGVQGVPDPHPAAVVHRYPRGP